MLGDGGVGEDDRRRRGHRGAAVDQLGLDHPAEGLGLRSQRQRVEAVVPGEGAVEVGRDLASREPVLARGGAGRDGGALCLCVWSFFLFRKKEKGELRRFDAFASLLLKAVLSLLLFTRERRRTEEEKGARGEKEEKEEEEQQPKKKKKKKSASSGR